MTKGKPRAVGSGFSIHQPLVAEESEVKGMRFFVPQNDKWGSFESAAFPMGIGREHNNTSRYNFTFGEITRSDRWGVAPGFRLRLRSAYAKTLSLRASSKPVRSCLPCN